MLFLFLCSLQKHLLADNTMVSADNNMLTVTQFIFTLKLIFFQKSLDVLVKGIFCEEFLIFYFILCLSQNNIICI
jgi:hypothetical protein